jgi:hypothetical protein
MRYGFWLVIGLALGCGGKEEGGDTDTTGETTGATGDVVSVDISAADGGTVDAFGASLVIPPGSLAQDTTITATTSPVGSTAPESATVHSEVFDFGPDGTTFSPAADLTLPFTGTPATDETVVVSWLDAGTNTWMDLPTTVAGGEATAPVEHFTWFVVRFVVNGVTTGVDQCDFTPCGGDPVGSWTFATLCLPTNTTTETNPFYDFCPDATFEVDSSITGSYSVNADGTWTSDFDTSSTFHFVLPADCTTQIPCSTFEGTDTTCTVGAAGECDCTSNPYATSTQGAGTWTTSGNQFTSIDGETGEASVSDYCVDGNLLHARDQDDQSTIVLTR